MARAKQILTSPQGQLTRDEALAICFLNLKGPRDKDLLGTAQALKYLKSLPEFGSNSKVGKAVGVSGEIVREFLTLLELPESIQDLMLDQQISLEQGRRLWQLKRTHPELVEAAAEEMRTMTAVDSRHLVDYILRHPTTSVCEAKRRILDSKSRVTKEFHVVAILDEEEYRQLERKARQRCLPPSEMVSSIVEEWLRGVRDDV